ncbi:MAG: phytanoyl-CoA dioxygenase family protein [Pseudomonadaceae bacterium]|nr:phytanoyl-CoA dioxygenase family protein [Pseudomonadaceae bacterium]
MPATTEITDRLASDGVAIVPDVLGTQEVVALRAALVAAIDAYEARGGSSFMPFLDPNDRNVRVFELLALDAVFRELILHPIALEHVSAVLGEHFLISNLTANIALPGSGSMAVHSDQALVAPEPWLAPWSVNIIWCLDDVSPSNGGTRYLPGSHRFTELSELPENPASEMVAIEAPAGSIAVMDGRVWHTSGANSTRDEERALLFGYYCADFLRPQVNWNVVLEEVPGSEISSELAQRLGLGRTANFRQGERLLGS